MATAESVSEYLATTPPKARQLLRQLRRVIRAAAPGITERISYRIPVFELDGRYLLYIAAFRDHVSVYPVTAGMVAKHGTAMTPYRSGKGTLRFRLDAPLPLDLVAKLARVRVKERRSRPDRSRTSAAKTAKRQR